MAENIGENPDKRRKGDTSKTTETSLGLTLAPSSDALPIAYDDNVWDIVDASSPLASIMPNGAGQYDQHAINEALAENGGGGAANIDYVYEKGEEPGSTKSVFDKNIKKGLRTKNGIVKVPSYYYTVFDNTDENGDPTYLTSVTIAVYDLFVGNCPIVQVVQPVADGGVVRYKVVYCDVTVDIENSQITIAWSNKVTVDENHPLYISILG